MLHKRDVAVQRCMALIPPSLISYELLFFWARQIIFRTERIFFGTQQILPGAIARFKSLDLRFAYRSRNFQHDVPILSGKLKITIALRSASGRWSQGGIAEPGIPRRIVLSRSLSLGIRFSVVVILNFPARKSLGRGSMR